MSIVCYAQLINSHCKLAIGCTYWSRAFRSTARRSARSFGTLTGELSHFWKDIRSFTTWCSPRRPWSSCSRTRNCRTAKKFHKYAIMNLMRVMQHELPMFTHSRHVDGGRGVVRRGVGCGGRIGGGERRSLLSSVRRGRGIEALARRPHCCFLSENGISLHIYGCCCQGPPPCPCRIMTSFPN